MKKIAAFFLLFIFLITNSGIAVNVHYCCGKISSIELFSFHTHPCKCGKKAMKKNCCKDKSAFLKINNDLNKACQLVFKTPIIKSILSFPNQNELERLATFHYSVFSLYHPPPFKPKAAIYLLDRVFLI